MFTLSSFRICNGNGVGSVGGTAGTCLGGFPPLTVGVNLVGTEEAGATARVNGVSASTNPPLAALGSTFSATAVVGAGFTPGVPIPAVAPTGQYAGGTSQSSGFALTPAGASVLLHSQTQLNTFGSDSSASSEQTLNSTFFFTTATALTFELSFDATKKLRAGLGQPGISADGDTSLSFSLTGTGGQSFSWAPGGSAGGIACSGAGVSCTEFSDAFDLNDGVSIVGLPVDFDLPLRSGYFEVELILPAGTYSFNISGQTQANAAVIPVPEPHTLALLGLGLLGLGVSARRKLSA
jgi:hypothetical protein